MKYKKLPLIAKCEDCVFCRLEQLLTCFENIKYHRCKHPDVIISQFKDTDPLKELDGDFPSWCPLEDEEI